ncbi:MAG: extracellular solute-binding protein [Anaerolineales bacterium]|jgi:ABC-type glycerol-3-phosphate transport system substrate-binding protein
MKKKFAWLLILALLLPMVLTACAAPEAETPTEAPAAEEPMEEPTEAEPMEEEEPMEPAVDPSGQTVVFWHVWGTGSVSEGLTAIVDEFNQINEWGITVEALDQGRYNDLEDAMNAAIQSGDVPDIVVGYTNALDNWYSVGSLVDMNEYVNDPDWGLTDAEIADFYDGVWQSGINSQGARVGYPHGQSANVLFYNYTWAQELGFDSPPSTPDEFREQACAATEFNANDDSPDNDGTGGYVLYTGASDIAAWTFAFGGDFTNEAGDGYDFTKPVVQDVANFLKGLWDEGCAFSTESYPNPEFASRKALFTASSTAGLPYQVSAFEEEGAMSDDVWGFIPFPGPGDDAAVNSYAQNSAIVKTNPEKQLASWLFLKWFTTPEINARWIEASAYHPIRQGTVEYLDDYIAENPLWADGIALVPLGVSEPGWASWGTVRREVQDTFAAILQSDTDQIPSLLEELNAAAAEAVEETS